MKGAVEIEDLARRLRIDSVQMLAHAGSGHLGGCLSSADIMAVLYGLRMRINPGNPDWAERDRFVLSIGHVAPVYYAALAECGFFPKEELLTLRLLGTRLQGHPSRAHGLPGVDAASGSLGQGLSIAVGLALAGKFKKEDFHTYVLLGDGELQEGQVWEGAMSASFHGLRSITALIDRNRVQIDGANRQVMELEPLADKWRSFGWESFVVDGNNVRELLAVFDRRDEVTKPSVIICETEMGCGVKSITGDFRWHGKAPSCSEAIRFEAEINEYSANRLAYMQRCDCESVKNVE